MNYSITTVCNCKYEPLVFCVVIRKKERLHNHVMLNYALVATRCGALLVSFARHPIVSAVTITARRDESSRKEESEKKRLGEECRLKSTRSTIVFWLWEGSNRRQFAEGEYEKPIRVTRVLALT